MTIPKVNMEVDGYYCPEIKSRWTSYNNYKLLLWAWMMNEVTMTFTPTEVSHNGFYLHILVQAASVILIGMPLAYSEICLGQYTNCDIFTMWNFFPLFRNVGYATCYVVYIKTIYLLVLTSWYLIYTFYGVMDPPPWLNCNEFTDCKCMVKQINITIFQHCLEAQLLFQDDCGMKTASNCFFKREIGDNCTLKNPYCYRPWKTIVALILICSLVYVLSIKNEKIIQLILKFYAIYVCVVILLLFGRAFSTSGTWFSKKITIGWTSYNFGNFFTTISRGFLSVGTGTGVLLSLSRDVPFRSPATMTTISICLFSFFVSFMFALIAFTGIKSMSYYHGEEENIIEIGPSLFFLMFASVSEIMIYFDPPTIWGVVWFSVAFLSLFICFWILYLFLKETLLDKWDLARHYRKLSSMILMIIICVSTFPLLCSDITGSTTDATEIMQTFNSVLLSFSLYWVYGIRNHNVDIIFMIGIKANYFWKFAWFINPIIVLCVVYRVWDVIQIPNVYCSYYIISLGIHIDTLVLIILVGIYVLIIFIGILIQVVRYGLDHNLSKIISPVSSWGPRDSILSRSKNMFLPEIMTREFLYRQVRIRGYRKGEKLEKKQIIRRRTSEISVEESSWSALTSN